MGELAEEIRLSDKTTELFDQLYRDNQEKVYKLALGLTGNANDAHQAGNLA